MLLNHLQEAVFSVDEQQFEELALDIFSYQSRHCDVYKEYLQLLQTDLTKINKVEEIPYLPIEFFKTFAITTDTFGPEIIFESSSTSGKGVSKHHIRSAAWYRQSFSNSFSDCFKKTSSEYCHLALLPSYLERNHSSLVYQINDFISQSAYEESGFYLQNTTELAQRLSGNERQKIPTILWGVTFALLDFAKKHPFPLTNTILIETGGMKGRGKEIVREELHSILKSAFHLKSIAGEYGMTELMSQAYAQENGIFKCPPWMRVTGREINDPLTPAGDMRNCALNIIDLANIDSCCFIATSDIGKIHIDGRFQVLGRLDNSDTRGCNLLL